MRMARQRIRLLAAVVTPLVFIALSYGQIDYRSDRLAPGMSGNLLDRNPMIGSGGYNSPVSNPWMHGRGADAIVTGNVTGLAGFHGLTPLTHSNRFRETLPSASLSDFQRISVGIEDVQSGRAMRPTYYLGQQETISDLGFIRHGLNRPGSSTVHSPFVQPRLLTGTVQRDEPGQPLARPDLRGDLRLPESELGTTQKDFVPSASSSSLLRSPWGRPSPFSQATTSSLFGAPRASQAVLDQTNDRSDLSRFAPVPYDRTVELLRELELREIEGETPGRGPNDRRDLQTLTDGPGLGSASPSALVWPGRERALPTVGRSIERGPFDFRRPSKSDPSAQVGADPDRFTLMYEAVWASQRAGRAISGFVRPATSPSGPTPEGRIPEDPLTTSEPASPSRSKPDSSATVADAESMIADSVARLRWADKTVGDPITTFANESQDRLNTYLRDAETALHEGEYYRAAGYYELARSIDPRNPLPWLGRGHALAAAGDFLSAVLSLERGVGLFPQIAAFRLDLPSIVGRHDAFDVRRAELERRLETAENYRLRFLLGYLELYSGLVQEGLHDLELAARGAPEDSVIAMFPDLVVGRTNLPPLDGRR